MLKTWPMLKSLVWKEFRELLPLIAAAIAAQCLLVGAGLQLHVDHRPSDIAAIWPLLYMVALLLAIASGLWQSWRESFGNQYQFLLHRPMSRPATFAAKMAFGIASVILVVALPLLCLSLWMDSWGRFHHRDEVGFAAAAAQLCAAIPLLHLGAFLSGVRPGRWYGSRFLPLFAAILLYIVVQVVANSLMTVSQSWWFSSLVVAPIIAVGFVGAILHVAKARDFS
jgi:hypothetical protein